MRVRWFRMNEGLTGIGAGPRNEAAPIRGGPQAGVQNFHL